MIPVELWTSLPFDIEAKFTGISRTSSVAFPDSFVVESGHADIVLGRGDSVHPARSGTPAVLFTASALLLAGR